MYFVLRISASACVIAFDKSGRYKPYLCFCPHDTLNIRRISNKINSSVSSEEALSSYIKKLLYDTCNHMSTHNTIYYTLRLKMLPLAHRHSRGYGHRHSRGYRPKSTTSFILIGRYFTCHLNHDMGPIFDLRIDPRLTRTF